MILPQIVNIIIIENGRVTASIRIRAFRGGAGLVGGSGGSREEGP